MAYCLVIWVDVLHHPVLVEAGETLIQPNVIPRFTCHSVPKELKHGRYHLVYRDIALKDTKGYYDTFRGVITCALTEE